MKASAVLQKIHSDHLIFSSQTKVRSVDPNPGKQEIWNIQQLITYVREWDPNARLDLARLQKKINTWILKVMAGVTTEQLLK